MILSLCGRERIPGISVASQEEALSTVKVRGTPGSCHHSQSPPDVLVHSRETCFPCTASTFKPRIDTHLGGTWDSPVGKPCGKFSWESLKRKPQIPWSTPMESLHCCYSSGGKRTCMPLLETRTDSTGEPPEVPQDPCRHWRGILRFRHRLHTRSQGPASTGEESREAPELLTWGLAFPEASRTGP